MAYKEILKLHEYCKMIGVAVTLTPLYDGYCIRFNNGGDVVQHYCSYGCNAGCVELAIGCEYDYRAIPLRNAKMFIKEHKERLNRGIAHQILNTE